MEWMSLVGNIGLQAGSATLKVVIVTRDQTIKSTAKDRIPLLSMQAEISAVMERGTVSASRLACEILQAKQYHLMESEARFSSVMWFSLEHLNRT